MKAILTDANQALHWSEVPDPVIRDDEVLIKVYAAAVNRADLLQRAGDYPPPPGSPEWMGLEISGEIVAAGPQAAAHRQIGEKVCALLGGGGYAEYAAIRWDMTMPIPKGVSMVQAAAMPEAFATAYLNLFIEGKAKAGETLLMHAGASGLASAVIPMAKAFGLRVLTTVRAEAQAQAIRPLGADRIVISTREDITKVMQEELDAGHGVDLAIDCLGGEAVGKCLPLMARGGRWIMIASLAGQVTEVNVRTLYKTGVRLIGSTLRSRPPEVKAQILAALVRDVWPLAEQGTVLPTICRVLPIQQAEEAQAILQRGGHVGKVVMTVGSYTE